MDLDRGTADAMTMRPAAQPLADLMREHRSRRWLFVKPGGNWGDQLIYAGAEALAGRIGLDWATADPARIASAEPPAGTVIYLHGGGGFNRWGSLRAVHNFEHALACDGCIVVQGPQSFDTGDAALAERVRRAIDARRCAHAVVFAREDATRAFLESLGLAAEVGVDHDTALHLGPDDLLRLAELPRMPRGRYDLIVAREDNEAPRSTGATSTPAGVTIDPAYVASSFRHWLRIHLYARTVVTNRLHSAVASAIAGIPVTLGEGRYHKNRSVYAFSLAARGVQWTPDALRAAPGDRGVWRLLPAAVQGSWKLRQFRLALQRVPID